MRDPTVAVTGATGFIGRHLTDALASRNLRIRALARRPDAVGIPEVDRVQADLLKPETLPAALEGVDVAYYLVHSMMAGPRFEERDRRAASNFVRAAEDAGVERIVYLGGLGEMGPELSDHLMSRSEVADLLAAGAIPLTTLRAAIILGTGGASWEMLRQLVERLPIMVTPLWVDVRCQPIALRDVLAYLVGCLDVEATAGTTFDIGGPDILTYREMMLELADLMGKRRHIVGIPVLTPRLSSYWVELVTDVPARVARPLIDGLKNEVVCRDDRILDLLPFPRTPFREAASLALRGDV